MISEYDLVSANAKDQELGFHMIIFTSSPFLVTAGLV